MSDKPHKFNFDTNPPVQVSQYDNAIRRFVPGYDAIFEMALAYLRVSLAEQSRLLIVGAGSGKELVTFGSAMPGWSLTGVDPSADMLATAREKVNALGISNQITLHQGFVVDLAISAKFAATCCILVMHFLPDNGAKLDLLTSIAERLETGAPLLLVDVYGGPDFVKEWGSTWILHGQQMGLPLEQLQQLEKAQLNFHSITEARTLELLAEAGFGQARRFYTALNYGGWIAIRESN